jgi:hypothetical protein
MRQNDRSQLRFEDEGATSPAQAQHVNHGFFVSSF